MKLDALLIEKYGKKGAEKMKSQFSVSELKKMFGAEEDKEEVQKVEIIGAEIVTIKGDKGDFGDEGYTPIKGKDYFTQAEIRQFKRDSTPVLGVDYFTPREVREFKREVTPVLGEDYFTDDEVKTFKREVTPVKGKDYRDGEPGKDAVVDYKRVVRETLDKIPKPKDGKTPKHEWDGKKLRFENPDGTWGEWVDLSPVQTGKSKLLGSISVPTFVDDETPTGSINDSNTVFTIANTPTSGSLKVFLNGARQRVTEDYTFSGTTITFINPPPTGSILLVDYRYE